ncbi:GIY-YIG nuclease family protein [Tumidithrix elongata]
MNHDAPDLALSIEHQGVPEAHQGLHSFLYSSEQEHAPSSVTAPNLENDGTEIVPILIWSDRASNAKVAAVYAVLDRDRQTQYVSYSRNVLLSLNSHVAQFGEEICAFVRVQTFKFPKREVMESLRDRWLAELDQIPFGNQDGSTWASTVSEAATAAMTAQERQAYEEKKLKIRKAMADTALSRELDAIAHQSSNDLEQRQKLESAVKDDDWSAVISSQTKETVNSDPH